MKTRTFKALLFFVLIMQLASIGAVFAMMRTTDTKELDLLHKLDRDLVKYHLVLGDNELSFAQNNAIEDTSEYAQIRDVIKADLAEVSATAQNNAERKEIYDRQIKLFDAADATLQNLKDAANRNAGRDRFSMLILMLAGMRKMSKIMHKMDDDLSVLIDTAPRSERSSTLPIAAMVMCALSTLAVGAVLAKGPPAY